MAVMSLFFAHIYIEIKNPIVPPIADDSIPPRAVIIKSRFLWPLTLPLLISTSYFFAHSLISGISVSYTHLQFRALNKSTSKLPKIDANTVDKAIGNNTADAILSGVI